MEKKDLIVMGAGPGGYTAAIRAAQLGRKVVLIEKEKVGGVCLNCGCIPTKYLLSFAHFQKKLINFYNQPEKNPFLSDKNIFQNKLNPTQTLTNGLNFLLQKQKIEIITGEATFISEDVISVKEKEKSNLFKFNQCIIATGSLPFIPSPLKLEKNKVITGEEFLQLDFKFLPQNIVLIGGGVMSVELGQIIRCFNKDVTIIELQPKILPELPQDISHYFSRFLNKDKIKVKTNCNILDYKMNEKINLTLNTAEKINTDLVIVCAGRAPHQKSLKLENAKVILDNKNFIISKSNFQTSNKKIFAIGDIVGAPFLAHKAAYQGLSCAEIICGKKNFQVKEKQIFIPNCIYTQPEIAQVGLTQTQLIEKKQEFITGKFFYQALGRAVACETKDGFFKILAEKNSHKILGLEIIGENATELISNGTLLLYFGATLEDVVNCIFAHPTYSEGIYEAAHQALKSCVYSIKNNA